MFYKKNSALIAGTLALCLSASLLTGCGKQPEAPTEAPTQAADSTEAATTATTPTPVGNLAQVETEGSLASWELNAAVWSSSNGATVSFTGIPRAYEKGQSASFVVRLEGKEVENVACNWDGQYYTASADLEAADGYEYECVIFPPQGVGEHSHF